MKLAGYLLLLALLASWLYLSRRRLKLALRVAFWLYLLVIAVRFFQVRDDTEQMIGTALAVGLFLAVWGVLWLLAGRAERSRRL